MKDSNDSSASAEPKAASTFDSARYWEERYASGKNSGAGSYGRLAQYKADFLNRFYKDVGAQTVIEFGSGDGNQAGLLEVPKFVGVDVSESAVAKCRKLYAGDANRSFFLLDDQESYQGKYDVAQSLDVIYHLVEDQVFRDYMNRLLDHAEKYVVIYASDRNKRTRNPHVRHRSFSTWMQENRPDWEEILREENPYKFDRQDQANTSFAQFVVYRKAT